MLALRREPLASFSTVARLSITTRAGAVKEVEREVDRPQLGSTVTLTGGQRADSARTSARAGSGPVHGALASAWRMRHNCEIANLLNFSTRYPAGARPHPAGGQITL